jgi:hypothetical protein
MNIFYSRHLHISHGVFANIYLLKKERPFSHIFFFLGVKLFHCIENK